MSLRNTGKKTSEETKLKLSVALKGNSNGVGNCNRLGKHLSEESKKKISEANKARKLGPFSEERKKNQSCTAE